MIRASELGAFELLASKGSRDYDSRVRINSYLALLRRGLAGTERTPPASRLPQPTDAQRTFSGHSRLLAA